MYLTKEEKAGLRSTIFRHLDGIGVAPTASLLNQRQIFPYLVEKEQATLQHLVEKFSANDGYLNVALRLLASQGWLEQHNQDETVSFQITAAGKIAATYFPLYEKAVAFIPSAVEMEKHILNGFDGHTYSRLSELFNDFKKEFDTTPSSNELEEKVRIQVIKHIEGLLAAPIIVALGINGLFHKYFSLAPFQPEEFSEFPEQLAGIIEFFVHLGWFKKKNLIYNFTPTGLFFAKRASAYGVTVSYLPMFSRLNELIFGNPNVLWQRPPGSPEIHVNRTMNVWGSGGAHSAYFKKVDEIIIEIFNRPIHEQPKGFADMGSGNGAFLKHIFETIWEKTLRGKMLEEYPLFIVGSDFNEAALSATRRTLNQGEIWAKVVWGDIGKPDLLAQELQDKFEIDLGDLLNVRSFLDHNRVYEIPSKIEKISPSESTGAFVYRGQKLSNREVEQNLLNHLNKWAPFVKRFGLLVIELHTIPPNRTASNLGKTAATAYDATHGYSDQYIVELDIFLKTAERAGLYPDPVFSERYPNSELATVSINLLKER